MASRCITRSCSHMSTSTSSSAARAFLQLAPRRSLHSTPLPVLDFLLPSLSSTVICNGWVGKPSSRLGYGTRRTLTSSSSRQQTTVIFNPRLDDAGENMSVGITPRASNRLKEIMSQDSNPNLALRIQVESGGCHGFQYLMSLTTLPPIDSFSSVSVQDEASPALNTSSSDSNAIPSRSPSPSLVSNSDRTKTESTESTESTKAGVLSDDDTVFAAADGSGAKVVMDGPSLELLKGSKIDYTMELIGSQFKIVDNPLATSSCGCGTSFDIKA